MSQVVIRYDGKCIIPVSTLALRRVVDRSSDGSPRRHYWELTLAGVLLPLSGSPLSDGSFYSSSSGYPPDELTPPAGGLFESLAKKKAALSAALTVDGKLLEIIPVGGTTRTCRPRWGQISFAEGQELNHLPYTAIAEVDTIDGLDTSGPPTQASSPPEEVWSLERADDFGRAHRLVHTVSSQQKGRFDAGTGVETPGWQVAKDFILGTGLAGAGAASKLGFDAAQVSGSVMGLASASPYNYVRSQTADEGAGRFTVTETWTLFDNADAPSGLTEGKAVEELTVETRYDGGGGLTAVTLNVNVAGLEERGDDYVVTTTRWANAAARAAAMTTAWAWNYLQEEVGFLLNPLPLSNSVARNKVAGTATLSITFDNRPAVVGGANVLSDIVVVEIDEAVPVTPEIPVPFRTAGPVIQSAETVTVKTVTVSADIRVRATYGTTTSAPSFNPLPYALSGLGYTPALMWVKKDTPRWVPKTGSYSRTTVYGVQG